MNPLIKTEPSRHGALLEISMPRIGIVATLVRYQLLPPSLWLPSSAEIDLRSVAEVSLYLDAIKVALDTLDEWTAEYEKGKVDA